jgi:hypothetical protein
MAEPPDEPEPTTRPLVIISLVLLLTFAIFFAVVACLATT